MSTVLSAQGLEHIEHRLRQAESSTEYILGRVAGEAAVPHRADLARIRRALDAVAVFRSQREDVKQAFEPKLVAQAHRIAEASRARVDSLRKQYFSTEGKALEGPLTELRSAAKHLLRVRMAVVQNPNAETAAAFVEARTQAAKEHAILATLGIDDVGLELLHDLANDGEGPPEWTEMVDPSSSPSRPLDEPLRSILDRTEGATADFEAHLREAPSAVWKLGPLLEATLRQEEVPPEAMVAALARDVVRVTAHDEAFRKNAITVVSLGLAAAGAIPSGGASLAIGAAGLAADGYDLYLTLQDLELRTAARDLSVDGQNRLADDAPEPWWVTLEALAVAAGALSVVKGLSEVGGLGRGTQRLGAAADRAQLGSFDVEHAIRGFRRTVGWSGVPTDLPLPRQTHLAVIKKGMDVLAPGFRAKLDRLAEDAAHGARHLRVRVAIWERKIRQLEAGPVGSSNSERAVRRLRIAHFKANRSEAAEALKASTFRAEHDLQAKVGAVKRLLSRGVPRAQAEAWANSVEILSSARGQEGMARKVLADFYQLVGPVVDPARLKLKNTETRAFFDQKKLLIDLGKGEPVDLWHELGHGLEYARGGHESAWDWVKARAKAAYGEVKEAKLAELTGNKKYEDEVAIEDHFIRAYVGKTYPDASEVLSMGLEHFESEQKMAELFQKDPEHFYYVLGVIIDSGHNR